MLSSDPLTVTRNIFPICHVMDSTFCMQAHMRSGLKWLYRPTDSISGHLCWRLVFPFLFPLFILFVSIFIPSSFRYSRSISVYICRSVCLSIYLFIFLYIYIYHTHARTHTRARARTHTHKHPVCSGRRLPFPILIIEFMDPRQ
jgi:Ca2+/Na+ antiporter